MSAPPFDTLAYVKRLRNAGFTDQQAEALVDLLAEVARSRPIEGATKPDLSIEFSKLRADLLKWGGVMFLVQIWMIALLIILRH